ncbi:MAG: nucleotide sugar dehydrogenase [Desulfobacterales bacterium]|jgi:UDP-N-acetyl-D-mannosaminuronic acid dehydrogenase
MEPRRYDVSILGGLGHVGLPLGIALAAASLEVCLVDINRRAMEKVTSGEMPFKESGAEALLKKLIHRKLFVSLDNSPIVNSRYIVVCLGTPVDEHLNPQFKLFKHLIDEIVPLLQNDQHLILRSTVFPGTTRKMRDYLREQGKKLNITFCPERISQGNALDEIRDLPQIIGAFDENSRQEAIALFSHLTTDIVVLDPMEAELAKLYTNAWRYIQFAIANQFYQIAAMNGLDFYRIFHGITHHYPRAATFPIAGFAAGPCLFKDTMQLAAFSNNNFFLGHAAMLINEGLPNFIVQTLKERYGLKNRVVGILGMAFKADSDDKRESLSYKLKKLLEIEAQKVVCSDVYIDDPEFISPQALIRQAEIVILGTPHAAYADLTLDESTILADIWNFFGRGGGI